MKIHHTPNHQVSRQTAYPAIGDQLDALMKGFAALKAAGIQLPIETQMWILECQAVKERYPKT